jgi:hypothetical protein
LEFLFKLSFNISTGELTKDKHLECESKLKEVNGYEILFHCFDQYPELLFKQYITIILANFHAWIKLPQKYIIILIMMREMIKLKLSQK